MAAVIAKRVTEDLVRQAPYAMVGTTAGIAAVAGLMIGRQRRGMLSFGR